MQICQSIGEIAQGEWNSLLLKSNAGVLHPAVRHEYLHAMEQTGCVTPTTGWAPLHLAIHDEQSRLIAAMPLYLKSHSYGEYVFDWAWAQAYEREGLAYYPKLLSAIPFTPVLAPKILCGLPEHRNALAQGLAQLTEQAGNNDELLGTRISTLHALFLNTEDQSALLGSGTALNAQARHVVQFHWHNQNPVSGLPFSSFDDFLQSLNQKKRKNIRAERRKAFADGVEITRVPGNQATEEQIEFFYQCYATTYAEHFSRPYLSLDFFKRICASMGEQVLLVIANQNSRPVASSFFLHSNERLYGRYWGCLEQLPCLHFELCYYQGIEYAIENGINWFEGGAQGEHKMARGLNPQTMVSAHWVQEPHFKQPINQFIAREKAHLAAYATELSEHEAFRQQGKTVIG